MDQQHEEIRDEIIEKALSVFARYGYKKTTMNDIARAAGKAKSSIYYYFEGKEQIFKAILLREGTYLQRTAIEKMAPFDDARAKLQAYAQAYIDHNHEMSNLSEYFNSEVNLLINVGANEINQLLDSMKRQIAQVLILGNQQQCFAIGDTEKAAGAFHCALFGLFNPAFPTEMYWSKQLQYAAVDLLIAGLEKIAY